MFYAQLVRGCVLPCLSPETFRYTIWWRCRGLPPCSVVAWNACWQVARRKILRAAFFFAVNLLGVHMHAWLTLMNDF